MAKVTQPLGSIEARGSVGGLTYNTWRGIRTVKTRSGPAAAPSALMLERLALAAGATANWKLFTQQRRDAWNAWAANQREPSWTGQDKRLTGYNWYLRLHIRNQLIFAPELEDPPNYVITHHILDLALSYAAPDFCLAWTATGIPDFGDYWVEIYITAALSAGINATIHMAKRLMAIDYQLGEYFWSPPAAGTYTCFARLLHITGLVTPFQSARITIPP